MSSETESRKYVLESDTEVARLELQHALEKYELHGRLLMPGIHEDLEARSGAEILESGTASGLWLRELADSLPHANAKYVGTDITTSFFPTAHWDNFTYAVQDVLNPWPNEFHNRFDLVHQRLVLVVIPNRPPVEGIISSLASTVKPGGWIQLEEADYSLDILPKDNGPACTQFLRSIDALSGNNPDFCRYLKPMLEKLGFEHVQEKILHVRVGMASGDKQLGRRYAELCRPIATKMAQLVRGKGIFDDEELDTLPERFVQEMHSQGGKGVLRIIWGRKPV